MENLALIDSFSEFKDEKLIDRVTLMSILEDVFRNTLKKKFGDDDNFDIIINPDKGDLEIWRNRVVVADGEVDAGFISSPQYWWFLKNNPSIKLEAVKNFDFTIDVSLNVGVLMRGADEKTVTKINNILTKLLSDNKIQDIYASYGVKYVAPE